MTSAISTELKFVPLEARNWKGPKVGRDEGRAEYDEPLNVATAPPQRVPQNRASSNADGKVRTLRNGIWRRPLGGFNLDVIQDDWCQNHSRYSHESLADD